MKIIFKSKSVITPGTPIQAEPKTVYKLTGRLILVKGEVTFIKTKTATPKTMNLTIVYIGRFSNKENTSIKIQ